MSYTMNHLVSTCINIALLSENTVDVICTTNTRHQKGKDNMKKQFIFIYRYNSLCVDNKEAVVWLLLVTTVVYTIASW